MLIHHPNERLPTHRLRRRLSSRKHNILQRSLQIPLIALRARPAATSRRDRSTNIVRVRHGIVAALDLRASARALLEHEGCAFEVVVAELQAVCQSDVVAGVDLAVGGHELRVALLGVGAAAEAATGSANRIPMLASNFSEILMVCVVSGSRIAENISTVLKLTRNKDGCERSKLTLCLRKRFVLLSR